MLEWDCCSYSQNNCWMMLTLTQHKKIPNDLGLNDPEASVTMWCSPSDKCDTHSQHMGHGPALAGWDAHIQVCWSLYFPRRPWIPFVRAYPFNLGQGLKMIQSCQKWPVCGLKEGKSGRAKNGLATHSKPWEILFFLRGVAAVKPPTWYFRWGG